MSIDHLAGKSYGPFSVAMTPQLVGGYVAATGDDPMRWRRFAPPSIASAALFVAAPHLLFSVDVGDYNRILLHSDQKFEWHRPVEIGTELAVAGHVDKVRERNGMAFVGFSAAIVEKDVNVVMSSTSTFIMSPKEPPANEDEKPEPPVTLRGDTPILRTEASLPGVEAPLESVVRSASRADLVRYAAASADFNPIHWDHDTAISAGFPRVICHGLLLASWMFQSAARYTRSEMPLASASLRFKKPVLAADSANIEGTVIGMDARAARLNMRLEARGDQSVTGQVTINR